MSDSLTQDIMGHLVSQGVSGTIKRGFMPDEPVEIIVISEYAGSPQIETHDGEIIIQPGLQVKVRGTNYDAVVSKLKQIKGVLESVNITLAGTLYQSISAQQSIIPLGWDNGKVTMAQNYNIMRDE